MGKYAKKLLNFDINDKIMTKNGLVTRWLFLLQGISCTAGQNSMPMREWTRVVGSSAHFFQNLFDEKNADATCCWRYNHKNITRWEKKSPGNNIFSI
jgi:hypothetical protein